MLVHMSSTGQYQQGCASSPPAILCAMKLAFPLLPFSLFRAMLILPAPITAKTFIVTSWCDMVAHLTKNQVSDSQLPGSIGCCCLGSSGGGTELYAL